MNTLKIFFYFWVFVFIFLSTPVFAVETLAISRTILIEPCESETKCGGPAVFEESAREEVVVRPGALQKAGGCGSAKHKVRFQNTPFNVELVLCGTQQDNFSTYAMLRSGPTTRRNGVVKGHRSKNSTLIDKPIDIDGKLYRATLLLKPAK